MQSSNTPTKIPLPFASDVSALKNTIPENSASAPNPNNASYQLGFPPITMLPIESGGLPFYGQDMNGILNALSSAARWANAGGSYTYDSAFANDTNVGGYPKGAVLLKSGLGGFWFNTVDNNTSNPDSGGAGWVDLSSILTNIPTQTSIAGLRTRPKTGPAFCFVSGYYSSGDGGGGMYYYDSADVTSADNGGTIIVATDGGRWKLVTYGPLTAEQFGAIGNNSADDTTALKNALAASAGRTLRLFPGKTYKIASDELVMPDGCTLDMNGATLNFAVSGSKRNLAVGNNCQVFGGTINNTVGTSGLEGTYQTPVVLGQYTTLTGVSNSKVFDLTINTVTPGGNGIAVFGDSHNISIENITFPDSANLGIGVLTHWSFNGGSITPYTGTTTHPHSIKIGNIYFGIMSYGISGNNQAAVFLSASYNIDVSNIYADQWTHGVGVYIYAGDWGFQFATAKEQALGMGAISVQNVFGQYLRAVHVYGKNPMQAVQKVWPSSIVFENVVAYGIGTDTESKGARIEVCDSVVIRRSTLDSFYSDIYLGGAVTNFVLENSTLRNSVANCFDGTMAGTGSGQILIRKNTFSGNNTGAYASRADINLANINGIDIAENSFNSPNCQWNVRAANTVTRLRAIKNHTFAVSATGPSYSFGVGTDTGICIQYEGNTSDVSPSGGVRGGQVIIPVTISTKSTSSDALRVIYASGAPSIGTWNVGDLCINHTPAVGQPKGWRCTVAGTPGTWVSEGNL